MSTPTHLEPRRDEQTNHRLAAPCAVHLVVGSTTSPFLPKIARTKTCRTPRKRLYEAFFFWKHVETCIRLHMRTLTMSLTAIQLYGRTAVLPKIPHSNSCKRVSNRPLRPCRGRFGTLLQQLECGILGRMAVGGRIKEASGASQKSLQNAVMQTYACFNRFFTRNTPRTGVYEGSCKFLYERFGGKTGSWGIQHRAALRCPPAVGRRSRPPPPWPTPGDTGLTGWCGTHHAGARAGVARTPRGPPPCRAPSPPRAQRQRVASVGAGRGCRSRAASGARGRALAARSRCPLPPSRCLPSTLPPVVAASRGEQRAPLRYRHVGGGGGIPVGGPPTATATGWPRREAAAHHAGRHPTGDIIDEVSDAATRGMHRVAATHRQHRRSVAEGVDDGRQRRLLIRRALASCLCTSQSPPPPPWTPASQALAPHSASVAYGCWPQQARAGGARVLPAVRGASKISSRPRVFVLAAPCYCLRRCTTMALWCVYSHRV